jgi:hypothetical protein
MSNTLTAIIPTLQTAANTVGRELVGFIPASYKNASAARAGYNQTVNYPIVPTLSAAAVTPAATPPAGTDITQQAGSIVMDNLRKVSWNWTGEERRALMNGDIAPYQDIISQTLQQAMRTLVNEIENSLWVAAYKGASRAYGTAATAPFGTAADLTDFAQMAKILDDNGAPQADRHIVVGSAAMANLRGKQSVLFKVNEAGTDETLRRGAIGEVMGMMVHNSYPIVPVTAGTGASATTDNAGYAVGATTLTLASAGTGTILSGDIVVITGDGSSSKYVVKTGDSDVSNGGTFILNTPGLRGTLSAATHALTLTATYTPNIALHRNGLHLVMRAPDNGDDAAVDTVEVTDSVSGLVFQLARYGQYMQSSFELRVLYGVKAVKSDFIATLIG